LLSGLSSCLIAISPHQKDELVSRFRITAPEKIQCIPLGFELDPYLRRHAHSFVVRRELDLQDGDFLVGWVGRITSVKDPFLLVETAKRVVERLPDCHFAIVGDGELRGEVECAVRQAGLERRVHLLGWRSDLADVYSDFDLALLTSRNEGTPLALLETMACGKPFVAPAIGGVLDLVRGQAFEEGSVSYFQNAALADREPRAMCSAILRLLLDEGLRDQMAKSARRFVMERFSADRLADDLAGLYLRLLFEAGRHRRSEPPELAVPEPAVTDERWRC